MSSPRRGFLFRLLGGNYRAGASCRWNRFQKLCLRWLLLPERQRRSDPSPPAHTHVSNHPNSGLQETFQNNALLLSLPPFSSPTPTAFMKASVMKTTLTAKECLLMGRGPSPSTLIPPRVSQTVRSYCDAGDGDFFLFSPRQNSQPGNNGRKIVSIFSFTLEAVLLLILMN